MGVKGALDGAGPVVAAALSLFGRGGGLALRQSGAGRGLAVLGGCSFRTGLPPSRFWPDWAVFSGWTAVPGGGSRRFCRSGTAPGLLTVPGALLLPGGAGLGPRGGRRGPRGASRRAVASMMTSESSGLGL